MVEDLGLKRLATRYSFMEIDEYESLLQQNVSEGMRVYWSETLDRAHIAAVTAILRSRHWLSACSPRNPKVMRLGLPPHFEG